MHCDDIIGAIASGINHYIKARRIVKRSIIFKGNKVWNLKQNRSVNNQRVKIKVPMDIRNSKSEIWQVLERLVSTLEHMQVPKGTGPGVQRNERPLKLSEEGDFILLYKIPRIDHRTSSMTTKMFHDIFPCENFIGMSRGFRINKTFITGASPGIPYKLWNKIVIGVRR